MYNILDIKQVFNGDYKLATEPTPSPRPGSCITSAIRAQGYKSTNDLPYNVVMFEMKYPAMKEPVVSEAIIVKRGIKYTKIAVSHIHAAQDVFSIMLLTTDQGEVHKVVHRNLKESNKTETELISDTVHFKNDEPFHQLKIYQVYVFCCRDFFLLFVTFVSFHVKFSDTIRI
ncbi:semaphorin-4G-like [Erpetoichthys calabaricus]|uniref:semaphorin-4G-like n=1 Tax=Erpetoichthys calabaricus TaxID=27687 RepID=UPI00223484C8|nr:semaphorin-4G-like [Erpetoichthys calabaricus]